MAVVSRLVRALWIEIQRLEVGSTYVDYTSLLLTSKYSIIPSVTKKIYLKGKGKAAMAKDINIQDLINKINKFREERDWRKFHNPKDLSISISLEASELLELFQWKSSEEAVENNLDRMKDEIADIFIYLLMLSDDLGLDLFSAVTEKMNKNNGKYPKELCKGKRDKYTAYLE